ncbi:hypothetical protein Tco_1494171 [Tanacetum coccineum]
MDMQAANYTVGRKKGRELVVGDDILLEDGEVVRAIMEHNGKSYMVNMVEDYELAEELWTSLSCITEGSTNVASLPLISSVANDIT